MTVFFSQLINGLSLGSIYALIALGYSMVYGIILLLNFAHGDIIMVGAYMSWFVMNQLGFGPVTAVCATIIVCTLLGVVIEKIAYTPLRSAPRISLLITAIGVSFFLEYTAELIMGSGAKVIPAYFAPKTFYVGSFFPTFMLDYERGIKVLKNSGTYERIEGSVEQNHRSKVQVPLSGSRRAFFRHKVCRYKSPWCSIASVRRW